MTEKEKYIYADENGNIHTLTEDELPRCPITGEPVAWIIGGKKSKSLRTEHINCRCESEITCTDCDSDYDGINRGDEFDCETI